MPFKNPLELANKIESNSNEIDINNLDMYDDKDIYETDEKGFVLLPKKYKKDIQDRLNARMPQVTKVKNWNEDKYNDMIDFINIYRGDNVPMGDIQNQLLSDYGKDYEDLVRYAVSKWAE